MFVDVPIGVCLGVFVGVFVAVDVGVQVKITTVCWANPLTCAGGVALFVPDAAPKSVTAGELQAGADMVKVATQVSNPLPAIPSVVTVTPFCLHCTAVDVPPVQNGGSLHGVVSVTEVKVTVLAVSGFVTLISHG
jgi:hypothetical protein